jgi:hypothetical protein
MFSANITCQAVVSASQSVSAYESASEFGSESESDWISNEI